MDGFNEMFGDELKQRKPKSCKKKRAVIVTAVCALIFIPLFAVLFIVSDGEIAFDVLGDGIEGVVEGIKKKTKKKKGGSR